jgi:hypothetical protein
MMAGAIEVGIVGFGKMLGTWGAGNWGTGSVGL